VIIESDHLPAMSDVEAKDMVEKMMDGLSEDASTLLSILLEETECFTKDGNGRIKKSEIIAKTGWKSRKVDEIIEECKHYIINNIK
jgi:hypothetical protein